MTKAERSRNLRYKRPALASMGYDAMRDELDAISDKCSDIHWWTDTDDETLLNALDGDEEDAWEFRLAFSELDTACERLKFLSVEECFTYMNIVRYNYGYLSVFDDDKHRRELLRYIRRQNEKYAVDKGFMTLREYRDYFSECRQLQYDWNDRTIRFPRCLADAHTRTSDALATLRYEELQREKLRKDAEARRKFKESTKKRRRLGYEKDGLMIRVPAALHEIVDEGRALHHCVGGYASRHAEGKLHILFIRNADAPDTPYFTMELSAEGKVVQVRGLRNCDPPKAVRDFVKEYKKYILPLFEKRKREKVRISA